MVFSNYSNTTYIEPWYIPMDILRVICTITTIIIALIFLTLITSNKLCRTVPMMLVSNTCLAELVCVCTSLGIVAFTLTNDIKQIPYQDSLCIFRGYLINSTTIIQNHSYNLQALYRYVTVVHPSRRFWQSCRFQFCLVLSTWIFGFVVYMPFLFTGDIVYNVENQICLTPLRLSFSMIYTALMIYLIPNMILNVIYFKLVRYVREMNKRVTPVNILTRAERELKMVRNIVSITTILVILGLPFSIFLFMSFFTLIPKYHFRIAFISIDLSTTAVMIALFKTTEPVKNAAMQIIRNIIDQRHIHHQLHITTSLSNIAKLISHLSIFKNQIIINKPNSSHQNLLSKMTESTTAPVSSVQNVPSNSPKKAKKVTKGKSTQGSSHPKYSDMVKAALKSLNDRGGSSRAAILKYVLANYSLDPVQANQHLKVALKNGVKSKSFKQTKGNGASGSFKLAEGATKPAKKKSTKPKKAVSSTSTASAGTKKRARSKSAGSKPAKKVATPANTNSSAATTSAAAPAASSTTAAAKPKKVQIAKTATKSASAAKKTKTAKPKKAAVAKPAGTKKPAAKKATKPKVKKATTPKKPAAPAAKKPAAAKKVAKPKSTATKKAAPKKAAPKK